ncbi:putative baseplate assembly protein [Modestobacter excelsi]|uniref:putative baseplate assembly protein n=1 Tax=Modestobacter excelsi TaxID=2213161 RepID=UPI00110CDFBE|nr:putative baseplate assembly protein [Modestobacter excelsi]
MSQPAWWGREAGGRQDAGTVPGAGPSGVQPELVDATREAAREAVRARIAGYTPDWTNPDQRDAGVALLRLFGTQLEPVLQRANRLPEKLLVEELTLAGVSPLPATPAAAVLQFTARPPDGRSVLVPAGFQVAAPPAGGGDQVVFETRTDLWATTATLRTLVIEEDGLRRPVTVGAAGPAAPFAPLGDRPRPGNAIWIGLAGDAEPYPNLNLGVVAVVAPVPRPAAAGGRGTAVLSGEPLLRWEVLDGDVFRPVDVLRDGTGSLRAAGIVELRLPGGWQPAVGGRAPAAGLRWLRATLTQGRLAEPPVLTDVRLNTVAADAVTTIRNEAPEPVQVPVPDGRTRLRLSRTPVLPGTVTLQVDDDAGTDVFGTAPGKASTWSEVPSLAGRGADDPVFTLDPGTGVLTFGDGVQGRVVPPGFRNVTALAYRVGGGRAGRVPAGAITAMVTSQPYVVGVTNPRAAEGGSDPEPQSDAVRRGAAQLRARGRAVAAADYGLLALEAPGAQLARAHGEAGLDPEHPGVPAAGVVGVLVVPPVTDETDPPMPTPATLQAVVSHLSGSVAPMGVRVVAAPATYRRVHVEAWVVLTPAADRAEVLRAATDDLTGYLHPLTGGDDGGGWPFGGALRSVALTRRLLAVPGIMAVPLITAVVDGLRLPACTDLPLAATELLWPERPLLVPVPTGTVVAAGGAP